MRLAVLFAVSQELSPFARRLKPGFPGHPKLAFPSVCGTVAGIPVLAAAGGMGAQKAAEAAEALVRTWQPELLVMAGVAGALSPELRLGELLVAEAVAAGEVLLVPPVIPESAAGAAVRSGILLSLDRVLVTAAEKEASLSLPLLSGLPGGVTAAVEMETAGLAGAARAAGVPWAAVRAMSDTAAEALPLDFNRLRGPDGDLPPSRVALAALTHPAAIPGLLRLGRRTAAAAEAVAAFLADWIERGLPRRS